MVIYQPLISIKLNKFSNLQGAMCVKNEHSSWLPTWQSYYINLLNAHYLWSDSFTNKNYLYGGEYFIPCDGKLMVIFVLMTWPTWEITGLWSFLQFRQRHLNKDIVYKKKHIFYIF